MNPSRIGTPVSKKIDEWLFHFNGKSLLFDVFLKRRRDPEQHESHGKALKLATFYVRINDAHLREQKLERTDLGIPLDSISGDSYNEVFEKVKERVWSAKEQIWEKVIIVASKGDEGDDKVSFTWSVALRSKDGTLFKSPERSDNWVTRRPQEILRGFVFDADALVIHPYTPELEASLKELDAMFAKFSKALSFAISKPEILLSIKSRLLPLTTETDQSTVKPKP